MPFFDATESVLNIVASNLVSRSVGGLSKAHLFVFTAATLTRCTIMLRMCDVQCTAHTFDLSRTAHTSVWDFQNSNIFGGALAMYDTRCVLTSTSTSPSSAREALFWAFSDTTMAKAGIETSLFVTVRSRIVFSVGSGLASLFKVLFSGPGFAGKQLVTPVNSSRFHWRSSTYTIDWGTAIAITSATPSSLCPNHCAGLNSPYRVHDGDAEATPELSADVGATYAASVVAGAARAAAWRSFWPAYWANNSGACAGGSDGDNGGDVTRTITAPLVVSPTLALVSQTVPIGHTATNSPAESPSHSNFVITVTETDLSIASPSPGSMKTETKTLLKTASKVAESASKAPAVFTATGTVLSSASSPSLHRCVKTETRAPQSYSPSFVFAATASVTAALQASPSSSLSIDNTASKTLRSPSHSFFDVTVTETILRQSNSRSLSATVPSNSLSLHRAKTVTNTLKSDSLSSGAEETPTRTAVRSVSESFAVLTATESDLSTASPSLHRMNTETITPKSDSESLVVLTVSQSTGLSSTLSGVPRTETSTVGMTISHSGGFTLSLSLRYSPSNSLDRRGQSSLSVSSPHSGSQTLAVTLTLSGEMSLTATPRVVESWLSDAPAHKAIAALGTFVLVVFTGGFWWALRCRIPRHGLQFVDTRDLDTKRHKSEHSPHTNEASAAPHSSTDMGTEQPTALRRTRGDASGASCISSAVVKAVTPIREWVPRRPTSRPTSCLACIAARSSGDVDNSEAEVHEANDAAAHRNSDDLSVPMLSQPPASYPSNAAPPADSCALPPMRALATDGHHRRHQ